MCPDAQAMANNTRGRFERGWMDNMREAEE